MHLDNINHEIAVDMANSMKQTSFTNCQVVMNAVRKQLFINSSDHEYRESLDYIIPPLMSSEDVANLLKELSSWWVTLKNKNSQSLRLVPIFESIDADNAKGVIHLHIQPLVATGLALL